MRNETGYKKKSYNFFHLFLSGVRCINLLFHQEKKISAVTLSSYNFMKMKQKTLSHLTKHKNKMIFV